MNILFICADQWRWDCLGCLAHPHVRTPHLDALAGDALTFTSAYAATAPCAPSRAAIFSGRYPDGNGLNTALGQLDPPDQLLLPQYLRRAGFATALIGKLHLKPFDRDYGFDHMARADYFYTNYDDGEGIADSAYIGWLRESLGDAETDAVIQRFTADEASYPDDQWRFIVGSNVVDAEHHPTTWTTDAAIRYLDDAPSDRPFFLNVSYFGPHQPYACPPPWDRCVDAESVTLPPDFHVGTADKPIFNRSAYDACVKQRQEQGWSEATHRRALAAYYGNIAMLDHHIGRLLQALRERGLYEQTLILFTADHGDMAGQFGAYYKSLAYDGSARVPLIIREPGAPRGGQREERPVSLLDLFGTCLDAAAHEPLPAVPSRSLLPLCRERSALGREAIWFKQGTHAARIDEDWKLLRDEADGSPIYELYDRREAPADARNCIGDPRAQPCLARLRDELDGWYEEQLRGC